MAENIVVELTPEEARQFVILKHFIGPQINQRGITYHYLKRLEPALDKIHEALQAAGHPAIDLGFGEGE